jgi:hypothetical protein
MLINFVSIAWVVAALVSAHKGNYLKANYCLLWILVIIALNSYFKRKG